MNEEVKIWYKTIERQKWENTFTRSKSSQISEKHVGSLEQLYYTTIPRGGGEYPEGDSCFSIYQISWIKMKKVTFCKLKTSLSRNFVYNLQTFRGFCQVHFYDFVANSA